MESICTTALPSIGVGVLFFLSEILPFVSTVKANGIAEFLINVSLKYLHKKKRDLEAGDGDSGHGDLGDDEYIEDPENVGIIGDPQQQDDCCEENEVLIHKK